MKKVVAGITLLLFSLVVCESAETCENREECDKDEATSRRMIERDGFFQRRVERVSRMVNIRGRVGSERLVNNRRIVDSDSRLSNFPEMQRISRERETANSVRREIDRVRNDVQSSRRESNSRRSTNEESVRLENAIRRESRITRRNFVPENSNRFQNLRERNSRVAKTSTRRQNNDENRRDGDRNANVIRESRLRERSEERRNVHDNTVASRRDELRSRVIRIPQSSDRTRSTQERAETQTRRDVRLIRNSRDAMTSGRRQTTQEGREESRNLNRRNEREDIKDGSRTSQERREERRNTNENTAVSRRDQRLETRRVRLMNESEDRRNFPLETSKGTDENNNIVYRSYLNQDYNRLDAATSKLFTTLAVILVLGQIVHSQLDSKRFYRFRHLFTSVKEKVC